VKTKQLTPDARKHVEELAAVRADLKALAEREEKLRELILEYADRAACALKFNADLLATVEEKGGRKRCDVKLLEAKFPEAANVVISIGLPYLQIETKLPKVQAKP
jgi:hypothetical protein